MDYKKVLRLHYVNHLSGKEISLCCGDCGKTSVNEFLNVSENVRNSPIRLVRM